MNRQRRLLDTRIYIAADFLMAALAWTLFFIYRKNLENGSILLPADLNDINYFYAVVIIPIGWILFYYIFDKYNDIYRLSRLATFTRTFFLSFMGVVFLFFTLILDDFIVNYRTYYQSFLTLFSLHFLLTVTSRMILLTRASRKLKAGLVAYNTIIIGGDTTALELYQDIISRPKKLGHKFVGFIDSNSKSKNLLAQYLPKLGNISELPDIIEHQEIEEVLIAIETSEHNRLKSILNILFDYDDRVLVKITPDMYDIMLGTVKMNHVYGAILIEIQPVLMPKWEKMVKRLMDIIISLIALVILFPLIIYIIIRVQLSSPGPIFFTQERVGQGGEPFNIIKFRSMFVDAEPNGPQLSHSDDERCTPWGRIMRKWRLDEIPQFWNVLKGDMSLVGPRPERRYYINKILQKDPHFKHLLKVRPGITSWGQVKYGYASTVEQMVQRMKFDILYLENMSLALDIKIMFYTVLVILQGKGK
ncbi:MAG TPA: sugar transferase [Saprospiraceae bacterium]|nr:sugar transferase [Saprospiraceae bacterium]HPQ98120.1 sugar transferase [Saprospiraceae bacterium]HQU53362.1 sugar transferase [Saprospiraceae bacterium]HRV84257.1 sugar transferase [Saprospiraceae bacterium]